MHATRLTCQLESTVIRPRRTEILRKLEGPIQIRIRQKEHFWYFGVALFMVLLYLFSAFVASQSRWGFDQFKHIGPVPAIALIACCLLTIWLSRRLPERSRNSCGDASGLSSGFILLSLVAAILGFLAFRSLSNGLINADGLSHILALPKYGGHLSFDEIWTSFIIARLYPVAREWFQWEAEQFYHVFSSLIGSIYVFVLMLFSRRTTKGNWLWMTCLVMAGGYMQLFFGDVENYAPIAVLVLGYIFASFEFIRGRATIVLPTVILSLAITFHLLAGWLLPSLVYLMYIAFRRKSRKTLVLACFLGLLVIGFTLVFTECSGLHLISFRHSHAAGSGELSFLQMLTDPSPTYYANVLNLLFLLFPGWLILLPLLVFRRIRMNNWNVFLIICATMFLLLTLVWKAGLQPYYDWNLYAVLAIPVSILVWSNVLQISDLKFRREILISLLFLMVLHSACWIVSNHFTVTIIPPEHMQNLLMQTGW